MAVCGVEKNRNYMTMFWLFLFGSVMGTLLEGIWCVLRGKGWETHAATVWGPFCIIYGFGAAGVYLLSARLKGKSPVNQFILFSLSGALVEYFGSLFQEKIFGSASWDCSQHFLNIGGRISLKMSLLWGVLGIVFVRFAFPVLTKLLSKLRARPWRLCLRGPVRVYGGGSPGIRRGRLEGSTTANNAVERVLDEAFDNDTMTRQYPNMGFADSHHTSGGQSKMMDQRNFNISQTKLENFSNIQLL